MVPTRGFPAWLALAGSLLLSGSSEAQESVQSSAPKSPSFWQAATALAAINGGLWFYNWHLQGADWADVGTRSWWTNLQSGFNWDDDVFGVNQVAHPYH